MQMSDHTNQCYHCGDPCGSDSVISMDKYFCCTGCKTVFDIFQESGLTYYYELQANPGASPEPGDRNYDFLNSKDIIDKLLAFQDETIQVIQLHIAHIHCSSCIWILENLRKLHPGIKSSQVDFPKKTVQITYQRDQVTLKEVVILLAKIGYDPNLSLKDYDKIPASPDRSSLYKLGVAGFAFGNIMFLSFPEYFEVGEFWLEQFKGTFRWLIFLFSLPVVFYSGWGYLTSAYKGIRSKLLNIDVPIALGIIVLFLRSTADIFFDLGSGFFDSLSGLIFFLLLGKFFQQKTYSFFSFEHDYKSYFPISVTRISGDGEEESVQVYKIMKGDRLLIRNGELIPVDGVLISRSANVDYSFVTGEAKPVGKVAGDTIFSGGKQISGAIEMEVLKSVSQSYLTQLWSNAAFKKEKTSQFLTLTDGISKHFTASVLTIAAMAAGFWFFADSTKVLNVVTSVLIIACPCAIALAAPFTLGNMLRIFGRLKFYVKDTHTLERLSQIDTVIFDKTGTITSAAKNDITYEGMELTPAEESLLKNTLRASNHPLSRALYELLAEHHITTLDDFHEYPGLGLKARKDQCQIRVGSASFVQNKAKSATYETAVHISSNDAYKGRFSFHNAYREGLPELANAIKKTMDLAVLSGDNEGEKRILKKILPRGTPLYFGQGPEDKLEFIKDLQRKGKRVLMLGDGLNDAGAFAQSDVGIAISENINVFSPACDAILDATKFKQLNVYMRASKKSMTIIRLSFILSLVYNIIGLYFAVTGQLQPIIAAILMPLSSISIVVFTTVMTSVVGRKLQ
ncbi:MAG TPA: heavy metal translocating P-type ATPase metal-binding domain-containing protein [Eudoraea sp.]|nr:heavy metal translocating P-type ATPase metal-binding domain-containing protein [Eudoraea sp.]